MPDPTLAQLPSGADPGAAWQQAVREGDFAAAFRVNDAVLATRDPATRDLAGTPYHGRWVWGGTPVDGRRVLVRCYHGLGDTLQFCRYLPALRRRAAHVTVEVQPELLGVLGGMADAVPFDPARPRPPRELDVEIMELAHALRTAPDPAPYLRVPALAGPPGRVGFCWSSGGWDRARDVPAGLMRSLATTPGVRPVSLQRGAAGEGLGMADPLDGSMDIGRMAGLLAGLTAVVTVDTMIAHLAGALGCPTILLLRYVPDWRWGDGTGRAPWYASILMVRQERPGDWTGAIERARAELVATLDGRAGL